MRGRSYHKLRETTFDLYTESERLPWYFKFLSTVSAWLVLAGYVLFSIAYTSTGDELRISPSFMTGLAATGVFLGYLFDAALAFLSRSLIFTFDGVLMPVLTASAVGLFSTIIHRALKTTYEPQNQIYLILPLAVATIATVIAGVLSWIVYRKLRKIKDLDARRRAHIPVNDFPGGSPMFPLNGSREVRDLVPDDEQQRRQLTHLLMAKADHNRNASIDDVSSTYRIDLPGEDGNRQRSGSLPPATRTSSRFTISGLSGRERSGTVESFKDPRERRRQEIEQSALMGGHVNGMGSAPDSTGLKTARYGAGGEQRYSPPLNGAGSVPRYR